MTQRVTLIAESTESAPMQYSRPVRFCLMIPGKNPAKGINLYISEFRSTGVENLVASSETCSRFVLFEVYFV